MEPLDLGVLKSGSLHTAITWIENRSPKAIELTSLQSSCECVAVRPVASLAGPGSRVATVVAIDNRTDLQFTGKLNVAVKTRDGTVIGRVRFEVVQPDTIREDGNVIP